MTRFADSGIKTVKPLFEEKVAALNKVEQCLLETRALIRRSLNQESMLLRLPEELIVKIFLSYNEDHHYPDLIESPSAGNLEQLGRLLIPSQMCVGFSSMLLQTLTHPSLQQQLFELTTSLCRSTRPLERYQSPLAGGRYQRFYDQSARGGAFLECTGMQGKRSFQVSRGLRTKTPVLCQLLVQEYA